MYFVEDEKLSQLNHFLSIQWSQAILLYEEKYFGHTTSLPSTNNGILLMENYSLKDGTFVFNSKLFSKSQKLVHSLHLDFLCSL